MVDLNKNFDVLNELSKSRVRKQLAHALLFKCSDHDQDTQNSQLFNFSKSILCQENTPKSCGECASCRSLATPENSQHPDFKIISPEKKSGYTVDQIRETIQFFALKKALSERRVLWIKQAEELNQSSGNALLKFLEEPQADVYILLSSANSERILSTILSRCQIYRLASTEINTQEALSKLHAWKELFEWIESGAPQKNFFVPADKESFWSQRAEALEEVEEVFKSSWKHFSKSLERHSLESARTISDFFHLWQETILKIKSYGNPATNWANLKNASVRGNLWKL